MTSKNNMNTYKYLEHNIFSEDDLKKLDSNKINTVIHEIIRIIKECKKLDDKKESDEDLNKKIKISQLDYNTSKQIFESNNAYLRLLTRKIDDIEFEKLCKCMKSITIYGTETSPLFNINELSELLNAPTIKSYHLPKIRKDKKLHFRYIVYIQMKIEKDKNNKYEYEVKPIPFITRPGLNYILLKLSTGIALIFKEYINVVIEMLMNQEKIDLEEVQKIFTQKYEIMEKDKINLKNECAKKNYMIKNLRKEVNNLKIENENQTTDLGILKLDYMMFKLWKKQIAKPLDILLYPNSNLFEEKVFKYKPKKNIKSNILDIMNDEFNSESEIDKYMRIMNIPKNKKNKEDIIKEINIRKDKKHKLRESIMEYLYDDEFKINSKNEKYQNNKDFIDICNYDTTNCYNFADDQWYYMKIEDPVSINNNKKKYNDDLVIIKDKINIYNSTNKILSYLNAYLRQIGCAVKIGREIYYEINYTFIKKIIYEYYNNL